MVIHFAAVLFCKSMRMRGTGTGSDLTTNRIRWKAYLNVLEVFDTCLELPSDSEKYFVF